MWRAVAPSAVVAAGAMMAFLLGIIAWRLAVDELGRMRDYRLAVQSRADERADELRTSLRLAISTTWSLGTLVSQLGGEPLLDGRVFERIAEALIEASGVGIGNLQLAPNGTVRLIAPLTDSDKPALGHALLVDPLRRAAAVATIRAYPERRVTLAGPLKLLQGSVALLGRHPVFSTQASEFLELGTWTDGQGETHSVDCSTEEARRANCHFRGPDEADGSPTYFWGFVTVLVSVDKLLQGANMDQLSSAGNLTHVYGNDGFEWQLIDEKPHVGFAETNGIFATSNGTNATSPLDDAITSPIEISDLGIAWCARRAHRPPRARARRWRACVRASPRQSALRRSDAQDTACTPARWLASDVGPVHLRCDHRRGPHRRRLRHARPHGDAQRAA